MPPQLSGEDDRSPSRALLADVAFSHLPFLLVINPTPTVIRGRAGLGLAAGIH